MERTLDDSACRRLYIPQAFLSADAILRIALNLASGLVVNRPVIERNVRDHLPYMATENLLMAAVRAGGDRQTVHEIVRKHSHAVTERVKAGTGAATELFDRLRADAVFAKVDFSAVLDPRRFVGRAPEQVAEFVADHIEPVRKRYASASGMRAELDV
jgi:adenylosuccinate lyase